MGKLRVDETISNTGMQYAPYYDFSHGSGQLMLDKHFTNIRYCKRKIEMVGHSLWTSMEPNVIK